MNMNITHRHNYNSRSYLQFEKNIADDYQTPDWLMREIINLFNVKVDICGDLNSSRLSHSPLFGEKFNALDADWSNYPGVKYCFPPFSKPYFGQFLFKAHKEWKKGESSIVMAPLKTIAVDYFQPVKSPIIHIIYPRINFIFENRKVSSSDSICLLEYNSNIKEFDTPEIKFLDLKSKIPTIQRR